MKTKALFTLFFLLGMATTGLAQSETVIVIEQNDGTTLRLNFDDVKQIWFEDVEDDTYQIDMSFSPTLDYLQGSWLGEYEGWDPIMRTVTKIRRKLTLSPDGTYKNRIQGVMVVTGRTDFVDFEHEEGTYTIGTDPASARFTITYNVTADSLLDFGSQRLIGYTKKHFYDHEVASYTETPRFTKEMEGKRKWITQDNSLVSIEDETSPVVYSMDKREGEEEPVKGSISAADWEQTTKAELSCSQTSIQDARSYSITVTESKITFAVNIDLLVREYENTPSAFEEFKKKLAAQGIVGHEFVGEPMVGGNMVSLSLFKGEECYFSGFKYGDAGTMYFPDEAFKIFREMVPEDINALINSTR